MANRRALDHKWMCILRLESIKYHNGNNCVVIEFSF